MLKTHLSFYVCCLSIISLLTLSCSENEQTQPDIAQTANHETETVTEAPNDERRNYPDNLPEADFDGYAYRIFVGTDEMKYHFAEEENGEIINDSIYAANIAVEERYNIDIQIVDSGYPNQWTLSENGIAPLIMAGDDFADLVEVHPVLGANLSLYGNFHNLYELQYLDFSQPWWFPKTVEEMTYMDKMFLGCSTISYKAISTVWVSYVNFDIWNKYNLSDTWGSVYDLVDNHKWTFDTVCAVTKDIYRDLNGDGKRDIDDEYGTLMTPCEEAFLVAFDAQVLKKTDDTLEVIANNERVVSIVEKMYSFMYEQPSTFVMPLVTDGTKTNHGELFARGNVLMVNTGIYAAGDAYLRNAEFDYGIIPMPMFDETQENYRCFADGAYMTVPITNTDLSRTGLIFEAMNAEGYRQIVPAYEEIALKDKYLRDENSSRMFDLVLDSYTASFAFNYDNWEGFAHLFGKLFTINSGNKDIVSYLEKNMKKAVKRADKVAKGFLYYGMN